MGLAPGWLLSYGSGDGEQRSRVLWSGPAGRPLGHKPGLSDSEGEAGRALLSPGSLGERLDAKFLTAYFFPAFVAVLGTFWILVTATGGERFAERVEQLDSVEQTLAVFLLLLTTAMIAHLLRALARPIAQLFAGRAFPALVKNPAIQRQLLARARVPAGIVMGSRGERLYPHDPADTAPTAFGNVLAMAADYPHLVYGMEPYHWWPRLLPLLPVEFQEMLRSMEAPMRAMPNLSSWPCALVVWRPWALPPPNGRQTSCPWRSVFSSRTSFIARRSHKPLSSPATFGWVSISIGPRSCGG